MIAGLASLVEHSRAVPIARIASNQEAHLAAAPSLLFTGVIPADKVSHHEGGVLLVDIVVAVVVFVEPFRAHPRKDGFFHSLVEVRKREKRPGLFFRVDDSLLGFLRPRSSRLMVRRANRSLLLKMERGQQSHHVASLRPLLDGTGRSRRKGYVVSMGIASVLLESLLAAKRALADTTIGASLMRS